MDKPSRYTNNMSADPPNPTYSLPHHLTNRALDIITLGSFVLERVIKLSGWPEAGGQDNITINSITDTFGGCATSVACYAARFGLKTSLISMIGDDEPCTNALQELHNSGVATKHMSHYKNEHGSLIRILADPHGEWASLSMVNSNLKFRLKDLPPISYFETAKILHIDGYACLSTLGSEEIVLKAVERANAAGCVISVDACVPAAKHSTNFLVNLFKRANIVFANLSEAQLLTGTDNVDSVIQSYRSMGVDVGIIKNGIHGSHVTTQISHIYIPAYQVDIIDSIAAGDAYVAGMLASLCKRFSIIKSANYASASGALACQGFGSLSNFYTFSHMDDLISQV